MKAAALPKHPLPKSSLSASTLAWIIVSKYCDALPLYRQENMIKRYGGCVTYTIMANSLIRLSTSLQPLINLMRDHQKEGAVINAGETRVQVIKESSKSINSDKYMWVRLGGPSGQPRYFLSTILQEARRYPCACLNLNSTVTCKRTAMPATIRCANRNVSPRTGCFDHVCRKFTDAKKGRS